MTSRPPRRRQRTRAAGRRHVSKRRGAVLGITAAVTGTLALSACSGGASAAGNTSGSGTITLMAAEYTPVTTQAYWQSLIKSFEARYPNTHVNLDMVNWNDITQKVDTLISTNQEPNLLNLNTFAGFAQDGLLYPASTVASPQVMSDFLPSFLQNDTYHGTAYALPMGASDRPLFYNKAIFQKIGVSSPPSTWQQLLTDAEKAKAAGYIGYGLPLGSEEAQAEASIWIWNNGGNWLNSKGQWTINSPQNIQAFGFLNKLANTAKATEANPGETDRTTGVWALFAEGRVAMVMGAPFLWTDLGKTPSFPYGIAPPPTNDGKAPVTLGVADRLMAFKHAGNPTIDREFVDFFYQPANFEKFMKVTASLPSTKSGLAYFQAHDPALAPYLKILPQSEFYSNLPAWTKVQADIQNEIGQAVQGSSPQSVLGSLQQKATAASSGN